MDCQTQLKAWPSHNGGHMQILGELEIQGQVERQLASSQIQGKVRSTQQCQLQKSGSDRGRNFKRQWSSQTEIKLDCHYKD